MYGGGGTLLQSIEYAIFTYKMKFFTTVYIVASKNSCALEVLEKLNDRLFTRNYVIMFIFTQHRNELAHNYMHKLNM